MTLSGDIRLEYFDPTLCELGQGSECKILASNGVSLGASHIVVLSKGQPVVDAQVVMYIRDGINKSYLRADGNNNNRIVHRFKNDQGGHVYRFQFQGNLDLRKFGENTVLEIHVVAKDHSPRVVVVRPWAIIPQSVTLSRKGLGNTVLFTFENSVGQNARTEGPRGSSRSGRYTCEFETLNSDRCQLRDENDIEVGRHLLHQTVEVNTLSLNPEMKGKVIKGVTSSEGNLTVSFATTSIPVEIKGMTISP